MDLEYVEGVHLTRTEENVAEIEAFAALLGGAVGLDAVLDDLNRQARRAFPWGLKVHRAFTWERADRGSRRWFPQGISSSAESTDTEEINGRKVIVVAWYFQDEHGNNQGSRLTFLDLETLRYRHVLLVVPRIQDGRLTLAPLKVHAGGVSWVGPYLHIAATTRGLMTCRVDDILRIPDERGAKHLRGLGIDGDEVSSYGYRYVLPVRFGYDAKTAEGHRKMKYSFLSLDRDTDPVSLVCGEYSLRGDQTRLVHFPLDRQSSLLMSGQDGVSRPIGIEDGGLRTMQGAVVARGRFHVTASHGPWMPGTVYAGRPGAFRAHKLALPMGPEDTCYWPSTDLLWSVTEHPWRRWVVAMKRSGFD